MSHLIKRIAYIFLYIPTLFVPNQSSVEFAGRKRIDQMNLGVAIFICLLGAGVIASIGFIGYLALVASN